VRHAKARGKFQSIETNQSSGTAELCAPSAAGQSCRGREYEATNLLSHAAIAML